MIGAILMGLGELNLALGVALLAVLAVRPLVRRLFGAEASYLLWFAPLMAGLAVFVPHPAAQTVVAPMVASASAAVSEFVATAPAAVTRAGPDLAGLALSLWGLGAIAAMAILLRRQAAFVTAMGRLEELAGGVFRAERAGVGPAVVGVLSPRIVTPADFEIRFGPEERALILAHEGVHLRRGDAAVNAFACAAQCLCWFNPLVHLAAPRMRIDQELACDARVMDRFPTARRTYAELLLKTQLATQPLPLGCHWPPGAEHPLKARIVMLSSPLPRAAMRRVGLALACGLALGAGAMAWAAQPGAAAVKTAPATPDPAQAFAAPLRVARAGLARPDASRLPPAEAELDRAQPTVAKPNWVEKPTGDDIARLYPVTAAKLGLGAKATVTCGVRKDGRLAPCSAGPVKLGDGRSDQMLEMDFGTAMLALAQRFRMSPLDRDGRRVAGGVIRIPVLWTPATASAAPPTAQSTGAQSTGAQPVWMEKPTVTEMARLYPPEAVKQNFEGSTTLSCGVDKEGRLADCTATGVSTFGAPEAIREDFRRVTLELAGLFRMQAQPPGGRVVIPIRWSLPTDPAAKARLDALTN
jgi:beta-lactamase regulating signal transducer with metallopeptidase domain